MVDSFKRIRHRIKRRLKHSPALVAGVIVGALAVLLIGGWAVAGNAAHVDQPIMPAIADENNDEKPEAAAPAETDADDTPDPRIVADDARTALDAASGTDEVNRFNSTTGIARTFASEEIPEIEAAVAAYHDAGYEVGFVMYDLTTSEGVGYNADAQFFSASTIKAPFVAFAAQSMVDGGQASFDEEIVEDVILDGTGVMSSDNIDRYDLQTVMSNTIVHSDNTGYGLLRERFNEGGFEAWCADADVDAAAWQGEWYPYYTPRDLAKLWLNIGAYVAEGQGSASWYADLLLQTDSSFLRKALGERHQVLSKPGYEIDTPWYDMGALNDAGLVLVDNDAYVIAIMSDVDYDDEYFTDNEYLIVDLASALGATHDRMMLEGGAV